MPNKKELLKEMIAIGDVISRIQTAQLTTDAPPTCSMETVLARLREIYSGKTPTPTFSHSEDYLIEVPEFILRDILTILVDNALFSIQHSGIGSAINIATRREGDDLCIVVFDDGPGIPIEVQPRIFRGFVNSTKGRGLGLLYARGAALNYHGDLAFVSHAGATRFTLRIPLHKPMEGRKQ